MEDKKWSWHHEIAENMSKKTENNFDGIWNGRVQSYNRGPCGLARNSFGYNPFIVGENYLDRRMCSSDINDCAECPLNPKNKGGIS